MERPVDKRIISADYLGSEQAAAGVLTRPAAPVATPAGARFKLFLNGAQAGPFGLDEIAQRMARGEVNESTKAWNMAWNPKTDKWQNAGSLPELAPLFGQAQSIPDPDDDIPDPD